MGARRARYADGVRFDSARSITVVAEPARDAEVRWMVMADRSDHRQRLDAARNDEWLDDRSHTGSIRFVLCHHA
jgi:hypothetical protein